jgi:hypothetical protein
MSAGLIQLIFGGLLLIGFVVHAFGRRTHLPRVTLLLLIGVIIGPGLHLVPAELGQYFPMVAQLALSLIGFMLGEEFLGGKLKRTGSIVMSVAEQLRLKESYKRRSGKKYILKLEPNAWMDCFPETRGIKAEVLNAELFERIETQDTAYSAIRKKDGRRVIGATALRRASMLVEYTPKTYGSKKVFSCADPDLRASFREHYKHLCALAREAYLAWKQGDFSFKIPPGMLAPRVPSLVSALPIQI